MPERNTIEMQAITALAHLTCSVLYFMDISEQCGYTIEQQCSLFRSIQPLFANKQLVVVINKIDAQQWETLDAEHRTMIEKLVEESGPNTSMLKMSNATEEGVSAVKNHACEKLLASRVDSRVSSNKVDSVMNRLQVVYPQARDGVTREAYIPESVKLEREAGKAKTKKSRVGYAPTVNDSDSEAEDDALPIESDDEAMDGNVVTPSQPSKKTARDLMWENGGPGVWAPDYREQYDLADPEWRFDAIPQILDGKNVADFVDPDIDEKLRLLEEEEEKLQEEWDAAAMSREDDDDLNETERAAVDEIRHRIKAKKEFRERPGGRNRPALPRAIRGRQKDVHDKDAKLNADAIGRRMEKVGVDASAMLERGRKRERDSARGRRRGDVEMDDAEDRRGGDEDAEMEDGNVRSRSKGAVKRARKEKKESAKREASLARSHSRPRDPSAAGLRDSEMVKDAAKVERKGQRKWFGGSGEGDQRKAVHLVKWMNTGKKRNGTHYCR
ncbi:hypothetical protein THAOC_16579 [Thalassiosira oceanica]|uniref:OBG-type G domain-containing protein n=1 Tax=Thalassiosira oceanica TaxID=159749 RepID=K0SCY7_THAOC|nr:hypothetical protein THAOC_16579 [Thalassiosira oceanica]|eukprot:EJK62794.1 hypothetical protein THAOC_16579 [Thalassiosira oceanica]